jgi:excisionase family DNA binding protein|tara:strand:- start:183 stop:434 length:252 start_codon:yes stop_codon:yes gene_type:complete
VKGQISLNDFLALVNENQGSISLDNIPEMMSRARAAEYLGCAKATLDYWASTGNQKIPYFKIGRKVVYARADLDRWLEQKRVL